MISKTLLFLALLSVVMAQVYTVPSPSKSPEKAKEVSKTKETKPSKSQTPMNYGYGGYTPPVPSKSKMPECQDGGMAFVNGYKGTSSKEMSAKESNNKECGYKVKEGTSMKMKEGMSINTGSYLDVYGDIDVDDDFMIDTGSYLGLYGGQVKCKSATIKGTYEVKANNDYMISSYGSATVDGYLNVKLPANYDFKYGARLVILKFASLIGAFKGYKVSYENGYNSGYGSNNNGYKRSFETRDEQEGPLVPATLSCTATECAIVSRVAPDAEATVAEGAPNNTRKLALAIGLGAGIPIVVAMFIAVVVVARRRRSQEAAAKNYDVEASRAAPSKSMATGTSTVSSSSSEVGVNNKSSVNSVDLGTNSSVSSV